MALIFLTGRSLDVHWTLTGRSLDAHALDAHWTLTGRYLDATVSKEGPQKVTLSMIRKSEIWQLSTTL